MELERCVFRVADLIPPHCACSPALRVLLLQTTTINMLTGMVKPTKGYAVIAGKDIRTQMNQIRQDVGICLQHDCLFPMLTVKEHIEFFARVKGMYAKMSKSDAEGKVMTSIEDVALLEKRNTLSKNLSGGMKRKLSVAIAFCGDSSTVLLDEPTYVKVIRDCCLAFRLVSHLFPFFCVVGAVWIRSADGLRGT
jgi:ABC-type ATPase involved in cell division